MSVATMAKKLGLNVSPNADLRAWREERIARLREIEEQLARQDGLIESIATRKHCRPVQVNSAWGLDDSIHLAPDVRQDLLELGRIEKLNHERWSIIADLKEPGNLPGWLAVAIEASRLKVRYQAPNFHRIEDEIEFWNNQHTAAEERNKRPDGVTNHPRPKNDLPAQILRRIEMVKVELKRAHETITQNGRELERLSMLRLEAWPEEK